MNRLVVSIMTLLLAACASDDVVLKGTPEGDYQLAKSKIDKGYYGEAALFLDEFRSHHPYSQYSVKAELLHAFAAYKDKQYALAESVCEEFIRRHPRRGDVAYAKYLLAMSHYKQVSESDRDQARTVQTIEAFKNLIKEHPGSSYAKDAAGRLQRLYNQLAEHELVVGKFYFDRGRFVASANRFQVIIEKYQTTPSIEEALYYLAASYAALGIRGSAQDTARILRHNYPRGKWSEKAGAFL